MKEEEYSAASGSIPINDENDEFSAPFDPTFWLDRLEEYFRDNGFLASSAFLMLAKTAWLNQKE
jgi:hypothetical protein